jgi:dipeptidyl-peptidase-4
MKKITSLIWLTFLVLALSAQTGQQISLEDILSDGTFKAESIDGLRSMNDGDHYTLQENNSRIVKYSYATGQMVETLFDLSEIENAQIRAFSDYEFSDDETKILLITEKQRIYRHSYKAEYYIWNSVTEEFSRLSEKGPQQLADFSPDGNYVAFVRDNNIFIKNLKFGSESQITFDGKENEVINGSPDWVYEEEFGFNKAFWWSPDSKFIAFLRFDESAVPGYYLKMYTGDKPALAENRLYPGIKTFKYPKAGEQNSVVTVKTYELYSRVTMEMDAGRGQNSYIPRLNWTPDAKDLVIMRLNRRQNELDILYANPFTGDSRPILTEKNDRYIDESFLDAFKYFDDGRFVIISERDGWSHIYLYDRLGFLQSQITKGEFDVTDFYGYDKAKDIFYYQTAAESPLTREVRFISSDGKKQGKLSGQTGTNKASFSKNFAYYVNYYSNSATPEFITLHDTRKNQLIRVLQDNTKLKGKLQNYNLPAKEFFSFTTSAGVELHGFMIKPANFNISEKYPVIIDQYSGPNSQRVTDSWKRIHWNHYLAQEGFVVVTVDPRGTAARGEDFRKSTYLRLGKYESEDMIETASYLKTLPYVDGNNIGIFGWSYGGFITCLSMCKGSDVFKAGIAVAPVTNWRFYDTVYTERYMGIPNDNPEGYDENSPLNHAGKLKGRLLIIHGSADDNVHPQNTYEFTEKLVQAGVQFDMAIYTNRNHNITGGNTSMHLYTRMTEFFKEHLK